MTVGKKNGNNVKGKACPEIEALGVAWFLSAGRINLKIRDNGQWRRRILGIIEL